MGSSDSNRASLLVCYSQSAAMKASLLALGLLCLFVDLGFSAPSHQYGGGVVWGEWSAWTPDQNGELTRSRYPKSFEADNTENVVEDGHEEVSKEEDSKEEVSEEEESEEESEDSSEEDSSEEDSSE